MHTFICFHQYDNLHLLHAITTFKPSHIHIIYDTDKASDENLYEFENYLKAKNYRMSQSYISLTSNFKTITSTINGLAKAYKTPVALFLPSFERAFSYNLLLEFMASSIIFLTSDEDGTIYQRHQNRFEPLPINHGLTVQDLITSRGGMIDMSSTSFFEKTLLIDLLDFLEAHIDDYYQLFRYPSKPPFYETHREEPRRLDLNTTDIAATHMPFFNTFINFIKQKNIANITRMSKHHYRVLFHDRRYKSYLLKSGTWLEHRLFLLFKSLDFHDVQASIAFLWDKDYPRAKNECDVMGMYYNRLFVASCKDTHHLSPDYINELYANANHLAHTDTKTLLFTTATLSPGIQEKADEFNVTLITYDTKNRNGFIKDFKRKLFSSS